ncbi:MAG: tRNA (cytidine(34)-2'-O)-methyltransferase [Lachnospiraceae bacterium]|nr:tRNA (cytidine(34)-2'-O)-methyltransferase [Lachnospiraceae bacterium]
MHIVLLEPEIPGNTGNIGRTCAATHTPLHLIEPLGFQVTERAIRRAGMDYWKQIELYQYSDFEHFQREHPQGRIWMATTKARRSYTDVSFGKEDFILFGKESAGIPEEILIQNEPTCIRIPMYSDIRSLNLSNSVAIVLYEALRQHGFAGMSDTGELHHHSWDIPEDL